MLLKLKLFKSVKNRLQTRQPILPSAGTRFSVVVGLGLLGSVLGLVLGGCGVISNGLETTSDSVQSVTDITGSTSGALSADDSAQAFVRENFDTISRDAARGGGQSIVALAAVLHIKDDRQLASWMQKNHQRLFSSDTAERADTASERLVALIRFDNRG